LIVTRSPSRLPVLHGFPLRTCCRHYSGRRSNPRAFSVRLTSAPRGSSCFRRPSHSGHMVGSCIGRFRSLLSVHSRYGPLSRGVT
jgi:DMSO/TMAO reductase YedYZ molybdopterin-dependent catalytic subunit